MIPGSANALLLASAAAGGYQISRSLRFNSSDSAYLSRTPASAGNRKTWTWAGWVKRSALGVEQRFFSASTASTNSSYFEFTSGDQLSVLNYVSSSVKTQRVTTQVFRDPSAWYHIVVSSDSSTSFKIYVNGGEVTTFASSTGPDTSDWFFSAANLHTIGTTSYSLANYFSGYLADIYFIDGQALTPSSFTEVSATTGQLIPRAYSGSYGTNGFKLTFSGNSNNTATTLGKDTSGNGNNWTPNNLQTTTGGPTSVAAASGALPIYNTTDTYGATKGSGTRTDGNSSSIKLAVAMDGANNGTTFTEESATIRGSGSALSITRNGNVVTSTTQSKFYGSSGYFPGGGNTDCLTIGSGTSISGTDDFTIEYWYFQTGQPVNVGSVIRQSGSGGSDIGIIHWGGNYSFYPLTTNTGVATVSNKWTHVAFSRQSGTLRLFVDGALRWTSTSNTTTVLNSSNSFFIGSSGPSYGLSEYFQGYLSDVRIYGGAAKYTSNFNPPSSTQNATVAAGNDSLVDTPTSYGTDTGAGGEVRGNYCTLNPLQNGSAITLSNGNLDFSAASSGSQRAWGTIGVSTGKWYFEYTQTSGTYAQAIGIKSSLAQDNNNNYLYSGYDGNKINASGANSAYGATWANNDVVGVAFDLDAGTITFYKNGTSQGQAFSGIASGTYFPFLLGWSGGTFAGNVNFGQRPFAYTAPSGFKALCTTNLPAPVIAKPSTVMDVKLYTGNGSTQTISGLGFSPDLVWIKSRSQAVGHFWYDQIRGAGKFISSDSTNAEADFISTLSGFTSDGFSLGSNAGVNNNTSTYAAWAWDAGSSTVTLNPGDPGAGSITSTVRANPSSGFSIVTYQGNLTGSGTSTVGHGLGVKPSMIITKKRSGASAWTVQHASLATANTLIDLNSTAATYTSAYGTIVAPTSSVFTIAWLTSMGDNGADYVAYCFSPVAGYANAFSFTGNGSTDGPAVWLGFRPKLLIVKRTDTTGNWTMKDSSRSTYNVNNLNLFSNLSNAETTEYEVDFLSNGFKVRNTWSDWNANGGTYVGFAWAESPFAYSRAR